jgi:cell division protein FtsI (penicillin-binding protein 3)
MSIRSQILLRTRIAFLGCVIFGLMVIGKIAIIQFRDGEKWRKKAEKSSVRKMEIKAPRGSIYANDGSLLATSLPFYKLAMDPKAPHDSIFRKGIDSLSILLSRFYKDKSALEYKRKIKDARNEAGEEYIIINGKILSYQEKKMMASWPIFRAGRYKGGAIFERLERRFHPFGNKLATRTVGFINENNSGAGLEFSFNKALGGRNGEANFRKMAGGSWKPIHDEKEIIPEQGLDIQTTIDVNLQDVAESSLEYHLQKHDAEYGCVMLMEVATGEIKAIANLGKSGDGGYSERYNYAVGNQGLTDPGSTFKLASMMALFEETNVQLTDSIETGRGQGYKIYDRILYDSKEEGFGTITVRDVFAKSSNIGVAKLIQKHFDGRASKFLEYIHEFGLDQQINFQMAGEAVPYVKKPSEKSWSGITLPWMSIGYELKLSPIHTLTFYNAVANGGKMIQPIIVKKVFKSARTEQEYETKVLNDKICSDKTLEKAIDMMTEVVESGTAKNIKNENYKIAGKTGTAQIIKNGVYTKNYYTSFCGFFPVENPKYSCIVVISEPKGFNQMGADVSAPVFKEIADKIYAQDPEMHKKMADVEQLKMFDFPVIRSGLVRDLKYLCNEMGISNHATTEEEWVKADISSNAVLWRGKRMIDNLMPDVTGLTIKDALYILENKGINVRYSGVGRVNGQSISPGKRISKGANVYLKLG